VPLRVISWIWFLTVGTILNDTKNHEIDLSIHKTSFLACSFLTPEISKRINRVSLSLERSESSLQVIRQRGRIVERAGM
jgi:hypothetical protein